MRRSSLIRLTAAAAAWPLAARAQAPALTVNVGTVPVADNVPFRYALEQGWFAQAGLDCKVSNLGGGSAVGAAVIGGAVDIGATNMFTAVLAHAKGIDVKIVFPGGRYEETNPTTQMLVALDSPIRTAKDLEGRAIAVAGLNDLASTSVKLWMIQNGADPDKARFVETPMSTMPALIAGKRIDAMVASEPSLGAAEATGTTRMLAVPYTAIGKHFFTSVWIANPAFLAAHRDAAIAFAGVLKRATIFTNGHFDDIVQLMSGYTKIPVETLRKMRKVKSGTTLDADDVQPLIDAAAKFHEIPKAFPAAEIMLAGAP